MLEADPEAAAAMARYQTALQRLERAKAMAGEVEEIFKQAAKDASLSDKEIAKDQVGDGLATYQMKSDASLSNKQVVTIQDSGDMENICKQVCKLRELKGGMDRWVGGCLTFSGFQSERESRRLHQPE